MEQEEKMQSGSDEVNLMEYVRIIIKRRWLVFAFLLAGLIIGGGVSTFLLSTSPETYQVETFLEIGQFNEQLLEDPIQVVEKIEGGVYEDYPGIKASNPAGTNLVKIEIVSGNPVDAKNTLENVNKLILADHVNIIDFQRNILEKTIEILQEKIDFLLTRNQETAILYLEVYKMEKQTGNFQPTKVVQEPTVEEKKSVPNIIFNLITGGILGIFLGVFFALGKEWWNKNKLKLRA